MESQKMAFQFVFCQLIQFAKEDQIRLFNLFAENGCHQEPWMPGHFKIHKANHWHQMKFLVLRHQISEEVNTSESAWFNQDPVKFVLGDDFLKILI